MPPPKKISSPSRKGSSSSSGSGFNVRYGKPVALAKEFGVPPQYIYNWIKNGAIKADTSSGVTLVNADEVKIKAEHWKKAKEANGGAPLTRGGGSKIVYSDRAPYRPGTMLTWHPQLFGRKPVIALIYSIDRFFTRTKTNTVVSPQNLKRRTRKLGEIEWRNETLRKLVDEKKVAILNPWEVIEMLVEQFRLSGQNERADRLHEWFTTEARLRKKEMEGEQRAKQSASTG